MDGHEAAATAGGGQQGRDVKGATTAAVATEAAEREALALAPLLVRCLNLRAELEGPRAALRALSDVARMRTYGEAIAHALRQRPGEHPQGPTTAVYQQQTGSRMVTQCHQGRALQCMQALLSHLLFASTDDIDCVQ